MTNRYYLTILLLLSTKVMFGQKCFVVYDSISKTKIAYANIWKENKIYANSDSIGKFCIKENELKSEYKISCIGYKTKKINTTQDSLFLQINKIVLEEVTITKPIFKNKIKFGSYKTRNIGLVATYDMQIAELGKVFIIKDSIQYFFNKLKFDTSSSTSNRIMGVKIYSLDINNKPKDLLTDKNIIIDIKKGNHITTVDLSKLKLSVPKEGFFISLQILLLEQNKQYGEHNKEWFYYEPSIGANKDAIGFYYFSSSEEGIWKKHENCDLNMQVEITN